MSRFPVALPSFTCFSCPEHPKRSAKVCVCEHPCQVNASVSGSEEAPGLPPSRLKVKEAYCNLKANRRDLIGRCSVVSYGFLVLMATF